MAASRSGPLSIRALFFLSGVACLGCELAWTKMLAAGLGHEVPSMAAVLGAFFTGMAGGSWAAERSFLRGPRAGRWFGRMQIVLGSWVALSIWIVPAANDAMLGLMGLEPSVTRHASVSFAVPFLVLLPATGALGASFPAMERLLAPLAPDGRCVGAVYAANTLGSVAGVLGTAFVLLPWLGFSATLGALAALSMCSGVVALLLDARLTPIGSSLAPRSPRPAAAGSSREGLGAGRLGATAFASGLLGIGAEALVTRVLSRVLEGTIYTFAVVLAVYLLATSVGASFYQRFLRSRAPRRLLADLLAGIAAAVLLGSVVLGFSGRMHEAARSLAGDSWAGVMAAEILVVGAVFFLPAALMGAALSHVLQASRGTTLGVGGAAALNATGCAVAAGSFPVFLLPALGARQALVLAALGYVSLLPCLLRRHIAALFSMIVLVLLIPRDLSLVDLPEGARIIEHREGVLSSVSVIETSDGHRSLRVDGRFQMGGTAAAVAERRQAQIPLLLHPRPDRVLFLGTGTGITLGAAASFPVAKADGVELVPEVRDAMPWFSEASGSVADNPGMRFHVADARRFVRASTLRYDVIVADLFHPALDGAGSLYTREHFDAIRLRLAEGGLFCQWLPLHQLDVELVRIVVRTFLDAFPDARAWLLHFNVDVPVMGLIAGPPSLRYPPDWVERLLDRPRLQAELRATGLASSIQLFGCFLAGTRSLEAFAAGAPRSTDDLPRVTFLAPFHIASRHAPAHASLLAILEVCRPDPSELLDPSSGAAAAAFLTNLRPFLRARDTYLRGLVVEGEGNLDGAVERYLQSAQESLYFTPAYARCVSIIQAMAPHDRAGALRLLRRLEAAQPAQPLGRELQKSLFGE